MRKGQQQLLIKAEKNNYHEKYMECLRNEDIPLKILQDIYQVIYPTHKLYLPEIMSIISYCNEQQGRFLYNIRSTLYYASQQDAIPEVCRKIQHVLENSSLTDGAKNFAIILLCGNYELCDIYDVISRNQDMLEAHARTNYGVPADEDIPFENMYHVFFCMSEAGNDLMLIEKYANLGTEISYADIRFAVKNNISPEQFASVDYDSFRYKFFNLYHLDFLGIGLENFASSASFCLELYDKQQDLDVMAKAAESLKTPSRITVDGKFFKLYISINESAVNLKLFCYGYAVYNPGNHLWSMGGRATQQFLFVLFEDGCIYQESQSGRLYPMPVKTLATIFSCGPSVRRVYDFFIKYGVQRLDAPVLKDIDSEIRSERAFYPPIAMNECRHIHNLNELCKNRWVNASLINWDRIGANLGYLIIKALPYVSEKDARKLLAFQDKQTVFHLSNDYPGLNGRRAKDLVSYFLVYYVGSCSGLSDDDFAECKHELLDYMRMSVFLHLMPKITFKSKKKIHDAHDKIIALYNRKQSVRKLHIPGNSQFNQLRKLLPDDQFEWIRDGERLYDEGIDMGHCVNGYNDYINRDVCAIYSLVYDNKEHPLEKPVRVTIEFKKRKSGEYYIAQAQTKYNRGCPSEIKEYINSFL